MKLFATVFVIASVGIGAYLFKICKPIRQFDSLERTATSVVTPAELQQWATNLVKIYPTNAWLKAAQLGTNFPQKLIPLAPRVGPTVFTFEAGSNSPAWVRIYWGSGFLGHIGFDIGPVDFEGGRGRALAPGVSLWNDNKNQ